tara:strand:+ start:1104 stop:1346 length:243 start_codon:yes stop_codon:yes gene_type:complete
MKVFSMKVKLMGHFADELGAEIEVNDVGNLSTLKEKIEDSYPFIKGKKYCIARNHKIESNLESVLEAEDEIALLPPFAGG